MNLNSANKYGRGSSDGSDRLQSGFSEAVVLLPGVIRPIVQYPLFNLQLLFNRMVYEDYQGTNTYCQQNVSFNLAATETLKHVQKFKKQGKCD